MSEITLQEVFKLAREIRCEVWKEANKLLRQTLDELTDTKVITKAHDLIAPLAKILDEFERRSKE